MLRLLPQPGEGQDPPKRRRGIPSPLLLAFSVGMNIAVVAFSVLIGGLAMWRMARTLSWRRLRAARTQEES